MRNFNYVKDRPIGTLKDDALPAAGAPAGKTVR